MQDLKYQTIFPLQMPPEYITHGKIAAQRRCISSFLPQLFDGTNKVFTIQAFEETEVIPNNYSYIERDGFIPGTHYKITLRIGWVQVHNYHIETYEEMPWNRVYRSAVQEVKYRIKTKVKNFFSNLGGKHG